MSIQILKLYQIHEWDGGERQVPSDKYLSNPEAAKAYKEKFKHDYIGEKVLVVVDSIEELEEVKTARIRAAALAKLDPLERKVLGV
jgi:hypothetical protein